MLNRQYRNIAASVLVALACSTTTSALAADELEGTAGRVMVTAKDGKKIDKGLALAIETEFRDSGFGDVVATGEIVNKGSDGGVNRRVFEMVTVEVDGDGDRRFVSVTAPASIKGTLFLSHAHALDPDDVWVMLPRSSRLRRISAQDKTGRFLNSELTLEDISPWQVEKYSYRYITEEPCETESEQQCYVIENTPEYGHSGYSRQVEWLDKERFQPHRIEYYDHNNKLLKVLEFSQYQKYANKHWRPLYMKMSNVQTHAESEIFWNDYQVASGYTPAEVSPTNIARLRR